MRSNGWLAGWLDGGWGWCKGHGTWVWRTFYGHYGVTPTKVIVDGCSSASNVFIDYYRVVLCRPQPHHSLGAEAMEPLISPCGGRQRRRQTDIEVPSDKVKTGTKEGRTTMCPVHGVHLLIFAFCVLKGSWSLIRLRKNYLLLEVSMGRRRRGAAEVHHRFMFVDDGRKDSENEYEREIPGMSRTEEYFLWIFYRQFPLLLRRRRGWERGEESGMDWERYLMWSCQVKKNEEEARRVDSKIRGL